MLCAYAAVGTVTAWSVGVVEVDGVLLDDHVIQRFLLLNEPLVAGDYWLPIAVVEGLLYEA